MTALVANQVKVKYGPLSPARIVQGGFQCDNCHRFTVGFQYMPTDHTVDRSNVDTYLAGPDALWYPKAGEAPAIEDVPGHIAAAAGEAYSCASIGANMAAILMARTVIEATAKEKGITKGLLVQKIEKMKDQNLIRPDIAVVAHEIRHLGNDMAHGDIEDQPGAQDAEDALQLMMQVLGEVFQGPALLERVRSRRTEPAEAPEPDGADEAG